MNLYDKRVDDFYKCVHFEKVDSVPVSACASAAWARLGGMKMTDYLKDYESAFKTESSKECRYRRSRKNQNGNFRSAEPRGWN